MKEKVILLSSRPYTVRDFHRFGAEYLVGKGYDVELWEIRGRDAKLITYSSGMYAGNNLHVYSVKEVDEKFKTHLKDFFLVTADVMRIKVVIRALAKYRCKYILSVFMAMCVLPEEKVQHRKDKFKERVRATLNKGFYATVFALPIKFRRIYNEKMATHFARHHLPMHIICSTHEGARQLPDFYQGCPITFTHAFDYDRYLEMERNKDDIHEEYILYCDSGYGSIIGNFVEGNNDDPIYENREYYFNRLERIFIQLEAYYKLPVVIAGHPHTVYDDKSFCGRKIELGKTEVLVKNAKIFVMTVTTAVNWAVLYDKQMLILYCDLFTKVINWETWIKPNMEVFKIEPCDMDKEEMISQPWKYVKGINSDIRKSYINRYIKEKGTLEKTNIEIIESIILEVADAKT